MGDQPSPSKTGPAAEDREALKKDFAEAMRATRPKDALAGLGSGLATAATGIAAGVAGLVAAPIVGAKKEGAAGFAKGLATGEQCHMLMLAGSSWAAGTSALRAPLPVPHPQPKQHPAAAGAPAAMPHGLLTTAAVALIPT